MARLPTTSWPTGPGTVFFRGATSAATLSRATRDGRIRRIAPGVYSADLLADPEDLVRRNRWSIVAALVPDALIADRSAATGAKSTDAYLFVVSSERSRDLELPGLVIVPRRGPGPLPSDLPWAGGLHITSDARTLVDNLAISRGRAGRPARTLARAELEDWLVAKAHVRPDDWLSSLREQGLETCEQLGVPERRHDVEQSVGVVAGTREARADTGRLLRARSSGHAWDPHRIEQFEQLAQWLADISVAVDVPRSLSAGPDELRSELPFYEAYFSNFIEGTEFTVEEAERIVREHHVPADRPADAHDVLGTFAVVSDPVDRATPPRDADHLVALLRARHERIMEGRPGETRGEFKERPNQAGSYVFVEPDLVYGTLVEGCRIGADLPSGFPRALYQLFLVSEVHPFGDGNGRVARATMNAELSAVGQARVIVPIVWRNEYLKAMRELSRSGRAELYARTLAWAWRWTAAMPWDDRAATRGQLEATHALVDSTDAERSGLRLELP
jgi:hypothetical protein